MENPNDCSVFDPSNSVSFNMEAYKSLCILAQNPAVKGIYFA